MTGETNQKVAPEATNAWHNFSAPTYSGNNCSAPDYEAQGSTKRMLKRNHIDLNFNILRNPPTRL
jgi:hypothetical protein